MTRAFVESPIFRQSMIPGPVQRVPLRRPQALWLDRVGGGALLALAGSLAFYRRANAQSSG